MFITHDDAQFYTAAFGSSSRAFVALGGWAGSWELWAEPFSYLSESWHTVAYDHRGVGATLAEPESITAEAMVNDVFAILDYLKIDRCVLAAESAGVAIAIMAALRQPERFQGLVLVDGIYYRPPASGPDRFLLGLENSFEATMNQFVDWCLTQADSDAVRQWGRKIVGRCSQPAAIRLHKSLDGIDLRTQVSQIQQPTLIIHGESDQLVPADSSRWLASQIAQCQLHILSGAGHVPTVTHARQVADAVNGYFADVR